MSWVPGSHPEERHYQGACLPSCWRTPGKRIFGLWFIFGYFVNIFSLKNCTKLFQKEDFCKTLLRTHLATLTIGVQEELKLVLLPLLVKLQQTASRQSQLTNHMWLFETDIGKEIAYRQNVRNFNKTKPDLDQERFGEPRPWCTKLQIGLHLVWWWENTFCTSWEGLQVGKSFLVRSRLLITLSKCLKGHKQGGRSLYCKTVPEIKMNPDSRIKIRNTKYDRWEALPEVEWFPGHCSGVFCRTEGWHRLHRCHPGLRRSRLTKWSFLPAAPSSRNCWKLTHTPSPWSTWEGLNQAAWRQLLTLSILEKQMSFKRSWKVF